MQSDDERNLYENGIIIYLQTCASHDDYFVAISMVTQSVNQVAPVSPLN